MKHKIMTAITGGIILIFLLFPEIVIRGAKEGLLMWFQVVLPALLPFSVFSMVVNCCGMTGGFARAFGPLFSRCFCINKAGCYPVIMGLLSGFPIGAMNVACVYQKNGITRREAQRIMALCNNPSPMFLVGYLGVNCMHLTYPILILIVVYGSAWLCGIVDGWHAKHIRRSIGMQSEKDDFTDNVVWQSDGSKKQNFIEIMDESIMQAALIMTKVGGYIIAFSILAGLVNYLFSKYHFLPGILVLFLEITAGAKEMTTGTIGVAVKAIVLGFVSFGGMSSVAQTASVISDTDLSVGKYIFMKLRQGIVAGGLGYVLISIFE